MLSLKLLEPDKLILIGASTGGPGHIQKIIKSLPPVFSASIIIAQHMGDEFIPSFVNQLQHNTSLNVQAVTDKQRLEPGYIYICSLITRLVLISNRLSFQQLQGDSGRYNPDIDQLFESVSLLASNYDVMGVILTGVGNDGARGCKLLSDAGGKCITESESSAVVYGMPLQAKLIVDDIKVQHLQKVIQSIISFGS